MLKNLLEHEIFHLEGIVNSFGSKESEKALRHLQSICKVLQESADRISESLDDRQKRILLNLTKQAQMEAQRVISKQDQIEKIRQDASILNSLEKSLHAI